MKTNREIAKILGVSDECLRYWLTKKKDAPMPKLFRKRKQVIRKYDEAEVLKYWDER